MPEIKVADIVLNHTDEVGSTIQAVYYKNSPRYAIYRTKERVMVQYDDTPAERQKQMRCLVGLSQLRGEITGLIDGWRSDQRRRLRAKSKRFDRRVADALALALEEQPAMAAAALTQVKTDILNERTSWARFQYLIIASITTLAWIVLLCFFTSNWYRRAIFPFDDTRDLWLAAGAGAVGAFFSIAVAIRSRTILTDLRLRDNAADAVLRIQIGLIAAAVLICLLESHAVTLTIGTAQVGGSDTQNWLLVMVVGFLAGFSERLVPDLLAKSQPTAQAPTPPTVAAPPQTNVGASGGGPPGGNPGAGGGPTAPPGGSGTPNGGAVGSNASTTTDSPSDSEEGDGCLADANAAETAATPDTHLPAASGGVAPAS